MLAIACYSFFFYIEFQPRPVCYQIILRNRKYYPKESNLVA